MKPNVEMEQDLKGFEEDFERGIAEVFLLRRSLNLIIKMQEDGLNIEEKKDRLDLLSELHFKINEMIDFLIVVAEGNTMKLDMLKSLKKQTNSAKNLSLVHGNNQDNNVVDMISFFDKITLLSLQESISEELSRTFDEKYKFIDENERRKAFDYVFNEYHKMLMYIKKSMEKELFGNTWDRFMSHDLHRVCLNAIERSFSASFKEAGNGN